MHVKLLSAVQPRSHVPPAHVSSSLLDSAATCSPTHQDFSVPIPALCTESLPPPLPTLPSLPLDEPGCAVLHQALGLPATPRRALCTAQTPLDQDHSPTSTSTVNGVDCCGGVGTHAGCYGVEDAAVAAAAAAWAAIGSSKATTRSVEPTSRGTSATAMAAAAAAMAAAAAANSSGSGTIGGNAGAAGATGVRRSVATTSVMAARFEQLKQTYAQVVQVGIFRCWKEK